MIIREGPPPLSRDGDEVLGKAVSKLQVLSPVDKERCKKTAALFTLGMGKGKTSPANWLGRRKGPLRLSVPSRICRGPHPPADWTWWGESQLPVGPSSPRQLPTLPLCEPRQPVTTTAPTTGVGPNPRRHSLASPIHSPLHPFPDLAAVSREDRDHEFARRQQRPAVPRRHWR